MLNVNLHSCKTKIVGLNLRNEQDNLLFMRILSLLLSQNAKCITHTWIILLQLISWPRTCAFAVILTQSKDIFCHVFSFLSKQETIFIRLKYSIFSDISKFEQCIVLLYGISTDNILQDPRIRLVTYADQKKNLHKK